VKVRTRLVISFTYILVAVIVGLTIPLAINLRARARAELETQMAVNAQTIAATVEDGIRANDLAGLGRLADRYADQVGGRVIVLDRSGTVLADSDGVAVGEVYLTPDRPEIVAALDRASPRTSSTIRRSDTLGTDIMAAAAPVIDGLTGAPVGAVRITRDIRQVTDNVRRVTIGLVVVGLTGLGAGLLIAFALAGSLARPLQRLADAARRLGRGDLAARAGGVEGASELAELGRSFDDMAERLERTVRAQREFVANASHQLRTPLTGMKLRLESAIEDAESEDIRRQLEAADREVDRLSTIVERLLTLARHVEEGATPRVDLGDAAARAADRWRARAERMGAAIEVRGEGAVAEGEPADVDQVLDNLIDNAIAYAPGPIEVETERNGAFASVSVRDHGPGIPADERARVTERFFRGRRAAPGGSGLGLAIARELAEKWGGSLEVLEADGEGTYVVVRLPAPGAAEGEPGFASS
jgi:signal transduction histidine kinase